MMPLAACFAICLSHQAQLSGPELLQDVDILERSYKSLHAGLYRYLSPKQVDGIFNELRRELERGATLRGAYLAFSEFAAKIRCGHTYTNFYNQEKSVTSQLFSGTNRVPFLFDWIDGRMIVTQGLGRDIPFQPGDEILSISAIPVGRILKTLLRISRADGSNSFKRVAYLNSEGTDRWEAFDVFLPMYFPQISDKAEFRFRHHGSSGIHTATVKLITGSEKLSYCTPPTDSDPKWSFSIDAKGVAHLNMPSWELYKVKTNWQETVHGYFEQMAAANAKGLIIDLRSNEGGNDVGDEIIRYLVAKPTAFDGLKRFTRYKAADVQLKPYLDTWDDSFADWGSQVKERHYNPTGHADYYRLTAFDSGKDGDEIEPASPRFTGPVAVLMNSDNSSATFQFELKIQSHKLGLLVGEPSGGNLRGINGGAFFFLRLPHSHIELDLPLIATLPTSPQPDRGLLPDVPVHRDVAQIAIGKDLAAEKAEQIVLSGFQLTH